MCGASPRGRTAGHFARGPRRFPAIIVYRDPGGNRAGCVLSCGRAAPALSASGNLISAGGVAMADSAQMGRVNLDELPWVDFIDPNDRVHGSKIKPK